MPSYKQVCQASSTPRLLSMIYMLIATGANGNLAYSKGKTPLLYLSRMSQHLDYVKKLLDAGADINYASLDGFMLLVAAVSSKAGHLSGNMSKSPIFCLKYAFIDVAKAASLCVNQMPNISATSQHQTIRHYMKMHVV